MTPKTFAARVDANHAEIRDALRQCGYLLIDAYRQGDGCPDMFVLSKSRRWVAFEIKSPGGKLTPAEEELFKRVGHGPLYTVTSPEQAIELMEFYDQKEDNHV